jgi:spore maturation protein CgeB
MKIALFYHSLLSDWNHGNAHFLRGVATELIKLGHDVGIFEPVNAWSYENLVTAHGEEPVREFHQRYPLLASTQYKLDELDLEEALDGVDLVIVHEWNDHKLVARIGEHRAAHRDYVLLFHDTHHRMVTAPEQMRAFDLSNYDGVLAFGKVLRDLYIARDWAEHAWTWHEAADTNVFKPLPKTKAEGDLVWIGNWGDNERTEELQEFLIDPIRKLRIRAKIHGVRYPESALARLNEANIQYGDWLSNFRAPEVFSKYRVTVHVPRRPYVRALPGIPTIRIFEALACGIPLICAPWLDAEELFSPGFDYLTAKNGREMELKLKAVLADEGMARALSEHGLNTIRERHTCAHRAKELLEIHAQIAPTPAQTV